jgi:hypothetical protein
MPPEPAPHGEDQDVAELVDAEVVAVAALGGTGSAVHAPDVVRRRPAVVAAQAAAVATTGFVAGAIATAVVSGRVTAVRRRRDARRLPPVVGTRRFLVDVHVLGDR